MVDNVIYQFWTGTNPISDNRKTCLLTSLYNLNTKIMLVTPSNLNDFILPEHPLHPGYQYLSCVHKSDYLRSYFMNFYGGGYTDIKSYSSKNNWKECFNKINTDQNIEIIGQKEIPGGSGIAEYNNLQIIEKLLANGYFICRPHSDFTETWYKRVQEKMDERLDDLKQYPALDPVGKTNNYKIKWTELQGDIFHKVIVDKYNPYKIKNCLNSGRLFVPYR